MGFLGVASMDDFRKLREQEDRALIEWEKGVKVKRCECGNAYSYGYPPVEEDPGGCQDCLGTGGELIP